MVAMPIISAQGRQKQEYSEFGTAWATLKDLISNTHTLSESYHIKGMKLPYSL